MPDITISPAQAAALARGENIAVEAPKPDPIIKRYVVAAAYNAGQPISKPQPKPVVKRFIAVGECGNVYEYETRDGVPQPWTVVRGSVGPFGVGHVSVSGFDFDKYPQYTVVEVNA